MNLKKTALLTALGIAFAAHANQPDSVLLFSYAQANGEGGLKLAWSADGQHWNSLNRGNSFVNSDFGPWGSGKRMYGPHLQQLASDGSWVATWSVDKAGTAKAFVTSPDLVKWNPQSYYTVGSKAYAVPSKLNPTQAVKANVSGKDYEGYSQKVPYSLVERLSQYSDHRAYRDQLYAETMSQDPVRFASLKPLEASLTVYGDSLKPISDKLVGIFFEDINYGADGGLYAELIQNRDFEYKPSDNKGRWTATTAWKATKDGKEVELKVDSLNPIHANNPHYVTISEASLSNEGWDGIVVREGEKYRFSFFARSPKGGKVEVALVDKDGQKLASAMIGVGSKNWKKYKTVLTAKGSANGASLVITPQNASAYDFDMVSLFPVDTFKGRENGLRKDLAQTLADLHPRFVRFPGGCVAHGNGIDNIYDWKGSIGPLEARKPLRNIWNYHQTRGLGYHEYFEFCEDLGAEPLPVLAAGVPCQNSGIASHCSHDVVTSFGQQGGIPMEEMPAYIQDVLDLIEYANGDPKKTEWGRRRAANGHPKPFNLKYIGIGNEDMITPVFEERFKMIADAVKAKHPEVEIVGTVGPFYEGTDYERGWELATEENIPIVDEHYYVSPGWMIHNNDFYDNYDRSKPKVYLGEYAAHLPGRQNNIETALADAIYLTGVERNADVVVMSSYAPLLAKGLHTQWNPDLIYFNNTDVMPTTDYWVQLMYGQNSGTDYVNSSLKLDTKNADAKVRVKASVVKDANGDIIVKLANLLPVAVTTKLELKDLNIEPQKATMTVLKGNPADKHVKPTTEEVEIPGPQTSLTLPAYSFSVLRLK